MNAHNTKSVSIATREDDVAIQAFRAWLVRYCNVLIFLLFE